jgi:murein DD-endopeptidase MepM/ murein hydrolase activator NlpD
MKVSLLLPSFVVRPAFWCLLAIVALLPSQHVWATYWPMMAQAPVPSVDKPKQETTYTLSKSTLKQGDWLELVISYGPETSGQLSLSLAGKTVPMFRQASGQWLGIIAAEPLQKPGAFPLLVKTADGDIVYEKSITITDANFSKQNVAVSSSTASLTPEAGELEAITKFKAVASPTRYWDAALLPPVPDCMNSVFGSKRYYNGTFSGNYHKGVDHRSPHGRLIRSTTGGVVSLARHYRLHGGTVGVDHGQGLTSIYIHMSRIDVKPGQVLKSGDPIGLVGDTGFASGPHLHWGLYVHGTPVNPTHWVSLPPC